MNTQPVFGRHLRLAVRGASHARALRFTLENVPAREPLDGARLAALMERRAPGRDALSTMRRETDAVTFLSGVEDGRTTGGTISGEILNADTRPRDYGANRTVPRPGHADFPQWVESGRIPSGGGGNSGRLTAALTAAGGICLQLLERRGISVSAKIETIRGRTDGFEDEIAAAKAARDSVGGTVVCTVTGLPAGLGGALFGSLETELSGALFAIPGLRGLEFGEAFAGTRQTGSAFNDAFEVRDGAVVSATNRQGGVLGGRTSGMPLVFRLAFRPTPTVYLPQQSVDLATMQPATLEMKGRHDPCIVRRALPVVEAVTGFALADLILADEAAAPRICLTLTGKTLEEDLAQYAAERYFTDLVELRADLLTSAERERAAEFPASVGVPAILTFRRTRDGGAFDGDEAERRDFFRSTLQVAAREGRPAFAYVDFEDDFRVPELDALARHAGTRIVRSRHDFTGPIRDVPAVCRALAAGTDEIAKLAFKPETLDDVSRLFAETADFTDVPHVVCAMGATGFATRALAGRTHSRWTYCSTGALGKIGHVTPHELVATYRVRTVPRDATLCGVTGWPLAFTRSPELNNAAFADEDLDAVMVPFPSPTPEAALRFMRALGMRELAVTFPHKKTIMPLLDEIAPDAAAIGAVNTIIDEGGRLVGYNTDVTGFAEAITAFAGDLGGLRVAVLGDGGAAQAVKAALRRLGASFEVFHRRTPPKGFDLLVNATPVDPIPDYAFDGTERVYDLGYVPDVTPLLARARAAGCRIENGFTMLAAQAREQRRLAARFMRPSSDGY